MKEIEFKKKAETRKDLLEQIEQRAFNKKQADQDSLEEGKRVIEGVDELLRQERALQVMNLKSQQELLKSAWEGQMKNNQVIRQLEQNDNTGKS